MKTKRGNYQLSCWYLPLAEKKKKQSPCDALFYFFILNVILFTMLQSTNINISKGCAAKEGTITVISICSHTNK